MPGNSNETRGRCAALIILVALGILLGLAAWLVNR